jgi:hypothetical protein
MNYRKLLTLLLMSLLLVSVNMTWAKKDKVTICHIPPGNPANAHLISVSENALDAHLGHGDVQGSCPVASTETTTETDTSTVETTVAVYTEVMGLVQNYRAVTGVFELDGEIIVIAESTEFQLSDGLQIYVRGFQLFDGRILAFDITQDSAVIGADFDASADVLPPILLDVSGMITAYDQTFGTITLDNSIVVLLVTEVNITLETGTFITVSGELLPDGRILADIVVPFEANVDVDIDDANEKVTICHAPPGNPDNAHNITINSSAIPAHVGHGDSLGACDGTDANSVNTCGSDACDAVVVTLVDSFGITFDEVALLRTQGYGMGEIARVYLLATKAGVPPQEIIDKRSGGMSWRSILHDYLDVYPAEIAMGILIGDGRGHSIRAASDGLPGRGKGRNGNGHGNGNANGNGNGNSNGNGNGNANGNGNN